MIYTDEDIKLINKTFDKSRGKKSADRFIWYAFMAGMLFYMSLSSIVQDWHGKEEYIRIIQDNWIDGSITVPIMIGICVAALMIYMACIKKARIFVEMFQAASIYILLNEKHKKEE